MVFVCFFINIKLDNYFSLSYTVEFEPEGSSDDDEETIAKDEALDAKEANTQEEIDALKRESEVPLEDLLSGYLELRDSLGSPISQVFFVVF